MISHKISDVMYDIIVFMISYIISYMISSCLENFSHQGPEHWHIDNCKRLANCTNNKEVYCFGQLAKQEWLEYPFRKSHPIIRWLPTKLAAWIGENFGQELHIPPKRDVEWTAGELNAILYNNLERHPVQQPGHNAASLQLLSGQLGLNDCICASDGQLLTRISKNLKLRPT